MIGDQPEAFMITGIDEDEKIATGDTIRIECGAIVYNYTNEINWFRDGEPVVNIENVIVEDASTRFSWRKAIIWNAIETDDQGIYTCEAHPTDTRQDFESRIISINVHEAQSPVIISNFNHSRLSRPVASQMSLECFVTGLPLPSLIWYKDDVIFTIDGNATNRISYGNGNKSIDFISVIPEDAGTYKCTGLNRIGSDFQKIDVEVVGKNN
jgi:FMS-like tyrosine kinase 1